MIEEGIKARNNINVVMTPTVVWENQYPIYFYHVLLIVN